MAIQTSKNQILLNKASPPKDFIKRTCSKLFIIRPDRSRLLEFEKKDSTGCLLESFFKYPDQDV